MSQKTFSLLPYHSVSPGRFVPDEVVDDGSGRKDSASVGCLKNHSKSHSSHFQKACLFLTMAAEKSSKIEMLWRL